MSKSVVRLLFCCCALLVGATATAPATASAGDKYNVDPLHTFTSFEYHHWGLSAQRSRFDHQSGFVTLDTDNNTGTIHLEIDAGSVNTGSEEFDSTLRSERFFDTEHFPKIVFNSTRFIFAYDQLSQVEGDLIIKDITRPVTLEITHFNCRFMLLYLKRACGANGYAKILRSDFKMDKYTPFVSDEVTLFFSVEGIRE